MERYGIVKPRCGIAPGPEATRYSGIAVRGNGPLASGPSGFSIRL
jgi:hypothetical protein